jgi:hypothetical protein
LALYEGLFFLADVRTEFGDSGSTASIVRLLLRVCEAKARVGWVLLCSLKVGSGLRVHSDDCSISPESRLSGVFCGISGLLIGPKT